MLAKPWFIFSEVLHVFFLAISTKVSGENLFHFTSSKNLRKKSLRKSHYIFSVKSHSEHIKMCMQKGTTKICKHNFFST